VFNVDDFTFFRKTRPGILRESVEHALRRAAGFSREGHRHSYDCQLQLKDAHILALGRVLACRSYGGLYWSVTFRRTGKLTQPAREYQYGKPAVKSGYTASDQTKPDYMNSIADQCGILAEQIFGIPGNETETPQLSEEEQGIVIVSGATGVAKSQIVRGVIDKYLQVLQSSDSRRLSSRKIETHPRRRHLITFEDPIEKYWVEDHEPISAQNNGIDYTPRQKGVDVLSLEDSLRDALRQKPSVLYVGETRNEQDWRSLLRFAGTGHAIFTTFHAASLVEAMNQLLTSMNATTAEARSEIARRIIALVHLRADSLDNGVKIVVPALWRRQDGGTSALMSDALGSLLPNSHPDSPSIGRRWFAEKLVTEFEKHKKGAAEGGFEVRNRVLKLARHWDLEGI
jgi:hypothetical protein